MENTCRKKLFRVTTADISLDGLLKGQLKYLNQYFEVVGVAKDTGVLEEVGKREGIRVIDAPLERPISLIKDIRALWFLYRLFCKEKPWCLHTLHEFLIASTRLQGYAIKVYPGYCALFLR